MLQSRIRYEVGVSSFVQRIGILGCGNIAGIIAAHGENLDIVACHDIDASRLEAFSDRVGANLCATVDALLGEHYPVLVEAASIDAVRDHLIPALEAGKDVVVLSVGALADRQFLARARDAAATAGRHVHVPSGAILGLDNLKVARLTGLDTLRLKSTKHPRALGLDETAERQCVFRGKASEAVRRFPKNVNVSAALGLATGIEPQVELWADPGIAANRHEILAIGDFGEIRIQTDNLPSPENPATSYLAALSVLALLERLRDPVRVGT